MFFQRINDSCTLTEGMAKRLGGDIAEAIYANPEFEAVAYRSAVLRCMSCKEQSACKELQASHDRLDKAPAYCQNW
ncbi:MAG: adenylosuccinate lyase [Rhodobacteraceae bacterium]|nr:MAG: adenylosuccinate lyase [Paracoccaceae bacterium]